MDKNFIATTDKETAETLKKLGFQMIQNTGDRFLFLNCKQLNFEEVDPSKIQHTNMLCC